VTSGSILGGVDYDEVGREPILTRTMDDKTNIFSPCQMAWQPIRSLKVTLDEIRNIVSGNDKQRFSLIPNPATYPSYSELAAGQGTSTSPADQQNFPLTENPAHYLIRANQGHSIALSSADHLTPLTLDQGNVPQVVVHGTYFAIWPAIVASGGLRPMGRTHIHCATGLPDDAQGVISGMRNDAEVLIYVDVEKCLEDGGMKWWMSENGVVLTEGGEDGLVPIRYFREVVGRCEGVGVLVRDGVQVGELPEGIKMRVPPGRRGGRRGGRGRGRGP